MLTFVKILNVFEVGFLWLVSHINDTLAENKDSILSLTELRDMYRQWLSNHGAENTVSYRSSHLKTCPQSH